MTDKYEAADISTVVVLHKAPNDSYTKTLVLDAYQRAAVAIALSDPKMVIRASEEPTQ